MKSYADQYGAQGDRWLFLTGNEQFIHQLAINGFHLGVEKAQEQNPILHSNKFVLIDRRGEFAVIMKTQRRKKSMS